MKAIFATPTVFVVGDDYEITVYTRAFGLCFLKIGNEIFYDAKGGVMRSETKVHKFRIKQEILDLAKEYEVIIRGTISRKSYSSLFSEAEHYKYSFKPIEKTENIKAYYVADLHGKFKRALACASYFGDETDLYIVNGDLGDDMTGEGQYFEIAEFLSHLARGERPVLFIRGNHDTKGNAAEKYGKYFPLDNKKGFFYFNIGILSGVALDLGEEEATSTQPPYMRMNRFPDYRRECAEYINSVKLDGKIKFAVSHIPMVYTTYTKSGRFDVEATVYETYAKNLEKLGISFMISGHQHVLALLCEDDERNTAPHSFPVIVGSAVENIGGKKDLVGTAMILNSGSAEFFFTDTAKNVRDRFTIKF